LGSARFSSRSRELSLFLAAFALATIVARLAGAGWGTAASFGQIAFAATLVVVLLRDP
jgi:hypothetical protein